MGTNIAKTEMFGWKNCYSLSAGNLEMVATADIGPRIIFFGEKGGPNMLKIYEDQAGRSGDKKWLVYGGHRVWAAPEDPVLSYIPDNDPVDVIINDEEKSIRLIRSNDGSGLQKSIELRVDNDKFIICNKIMNGGKVPVRTASWGLTSCAPGGVAILPLIRNTEEDLLLRSDFSLNLWNYTDLGEPSFEWHKNVLCVHQDRCLAPQKVGYSIEKPILAYKLGDNLIVKKKIGAISPDFEYPDRNSNTEVYFNPDLIELEFLSEWKTLLPGECVNHEEELNLIKIDDRESINSVINMVLNL